MKTLPEVNACWLCDQPEHAHRVVSWHGIACKGKYAPPSDRLRKHRLLARRYARLPFNAVRDAIAEDADMKRREDI